MSSLGGASKTREQCFAKRYRNCTYAAIIRLRLVILVHPGAKGLDGSQVAEVKAVASDAPLEFVKIFLLRMVTRVSQRERWLGLPTVSIFMT